VLARLKSVEDGHQHSIQRYFKPGTLLLVAIATGIIYGVHARSSRRDLDPQRHAGAEK
jgi:hypothetical protein